MIKKVLIEYSSSNDKYYMIIDGQLVGKYYNIEEVIKGLTREADVNGTD